MHGLNEKLVGYVQSVETQLNFLRKVVRDRGIPADIARDAVNVGVIGVAAAYVGGPAADLPFLQEVVGGPEVGAILGDVLRDFAFRGMVTPSTT